MVAIGKQLPPDYRQRQLTDVKSSASETATLIPDLIVEARHIAASVINGWHGRRKSGSGDSFWQFRPFLQGDAPSRIDWRRSARDDHYYIRDHEWQTAHTVWLWADPSASMLYQSRFSLTSKDSRAIVLMLALAELFSRSGERIASPDLMKPVLSRNGAQQLATALMQSRVQDLDRHPLPATPSLDQISRHSEIILISDFLQPIDELMTKLNDIAQRGIRAHLIEVSDPAEESFPFNGRTEFHDPVTGAIIIAGRAQSYAQDYRKLYLARRQTLREHCIRLGWSYVISHTDKPAARALATLHGNLTGGSISNLQQSAESF